MPNGETAITCGAGGFLWGARLLRALSSPYLTFTYSAPPPRRIEWVTDVQSNWGWAKGCSADGLTMESPIP